MISKVVLTLAFLFYSTVSSFAEPPLHKALLVGDTYCTDKQSAIDVGDAFQRGGNQAAFEAIGTAKKQGLCVTMDAKERMLVVLTEYSKRWRYKADTLVLGTGLTQTASGDLIEVYLILDASPETELTV